ncbi:MAG: hypothetical protein KDK40_03350, partial [Chlamydiia bacterium]|nr:hypothetical protein [Chlamydiia bacterium]
MSLNLSYLNTLYKKWNYSEFTTPQIKTPLDNELSERVEKAKESDRNAIKKHSWLGRSGFPLADLLKPISYTHFSQIFGTLALQSQEPSDSPTSAFSPLQKTLSAASSDNPLHLTTASLNRLKALKSTLQNLEEQANAHRRIKEGKATPEQQRKELTGAIKLQLEKSPSTWALVGWTGHDILLQYDPKKQQLRVLDSAEGELYHALTNSEHQDLQTKAQSVRTQAPLVHTIDGVTPERLASSRFYEELARLKLTPSVRDPAQFFYRGILTLLQGKTHEQLPQLDSTEFKTTTVAKHPQIGLCNKLLYYALCHESPRPTSAQRDYKRLRFFSDFAALLSRYHWVINQRNKRGISEAEWGIYNDVIRKLSKKSLKLHEAGILSESELEGASATIDEMDRGIQALKTTQQKHPTPLYTANLHIPHQRSLGTFTFDSSRLSHFNYSTDRNSYSKWSIAKQAIRMVTGKVDSLIKSPFHKICDLTKRFFWEYDLHLTPIDLNTDLSRRSLSPYTSDPLALLDQAYHLLYQEYRLTNWLSPYMKAQDKEIYEKVKKKAEESSFARWSLCSKFCPDFSTLTEEGIFTNRFFPYPSFGTPLEGDSARFCLTSWRLGIPFTRLGINLPLIYLHNPHPFNSTKTWFCDSLLALVPTTLSILLTTGLLTSLIHLSTPSPTLVNTTNGTLANGTAPPLSNQSSTFLSTSSYVLQEFIPNPFWIWGASTLALRWIETTVFSILDRKILCPQSRIYTPVDDRDLHQRVIDLCLALPAPKRSDCPWDKIPLEDIPRCMKAVEQLSWKLGTFFAHFEHQLLQTHLLAIQDKLARRLPETRLKDFETPYLPLLKAIHSPTFYSADPLIVDKLKETIAYLFPELDLQTLQRRPKGREEQSNTPLLFTPIPENADSQTLEKHPSTKYFKQFLELENPAIQRRLQLLEATTEELLEKKISQETISLLQCRDISLREKEQQKLPPCLPESVNHFLGVAERALALTHTPPFKEDSYREDSTPQNQVLFSPSINQGLSEEESIDLQLITADPYDIANRTLAFIKKYPRTLEREELRDRLLSYFLRPEALRYQLRRAPDYGLKIATRLQELIDYFARIKNLEMAANLAVWGEQLGRFVEVETPEAFRIYPNFRQQIFEELFPRIRQRPDCDRTILGILSTLSASHTDSTAAFLGDRPHRMQALIEDITAEQMFLIYGNSAGPPRLSDGVVSAIERKIKFSNQRYSIAFEKTLQSDDQLCQAVCEHIIKVLYPETSSKGLFGRRWIGSYPTFTNGAFEIDLERISIRRQGAAHPVEKLPKVVVQDQVFWKICKDPIELIDQYDETHYTIYPQRIHIDMSNDQPKYSKTINGLLYRFSSEHFDLKDRLPIPKECDVRVWYYAAGDDYKHWPHLLIVPDDSELTPFYAELSSTLVDQSEIRALYRVVENGGKKIREQMLSLNNLDRSLHFLRGVASSPEDVTGWIVHEDKSFRIRSINLRNLNLDFHAVDRGGESQLESSHHPGFFLRPPRHIPEINAGIPLVLLENQQRETKVLLPISYLTKNTLQKDENIDQRIAPKEDSVVLRDKEKNIQAYTTFKLEKGRLVPTDAESTLYLIYLHAIHGRIEEAEKLLKGFSAIDRLKPQQVAIAFFLSHYIKENAPDDTRLQTLLLRVMTLVAENAQQFPLSKNDDRGMLFTLPNLWQWSTKNLFKDFSIGTKIPLPEIQKFFSILADGRDELLEEAKKSKDQHPLIALFSLLSQTPYSFLESIKSQEDQNRFDRTFELIESLAKDPVSCLNSGQGKRLLEEIEKETPPTPQQIVDLTLRILQSNPKPLIESNIKSEENFIDQLLNNSLRQNEHALGQQLAGGFPSFYRILYSASGENRAKILHWLRLHHYAFSQGGKLLAELLLALGENSARFPSPSQLYEELQEANRPVRSYGIDALSAIVKGLAPKAPEHSPLKATAEPSKIAKLWESIRQWVAPKPPPAVPDVIEEPEHSEASSVEPITPPDTHLAELASETSAFTESEEATIESNRKLLDAYFEIKESTLDLAIGHEKRPQLPNSHPDPLVARKLAEEQEELDAYHDSLLEESKAQTFVLKRSYKPWRKNSLREFEEILEERIASMQTALDTQREQLLWQANHAVHNAHEHIKRKLSNRVSETVLEFDDLLRLFVRGNLENYSQETKLPKERCEELFLSTSSYLLQATRMQQLRRSLKLAREARSNSGEKRNELIQRAAQTLKAERAYSFGDPDAHEFALQRIILAHEYANNIFFRGEQLVKAKEILNAIANHQHNLANMPTGYGKTKTMGPVIAEALLQRIFGDHPFHLIDAWPAELEIINTLDSKKQLKSGAAREVYRSYFDRSSRPSVSSLRMLYKQLWEDHRRGHCRSLRPETLRSLELHMLSLTTRLRDEEKTLTPALLKKLRAQVYWLIKINRFTRLKSLGKVDEAHRNLHPKKSRLKFTHGRPTRLPETHIALVEKLIGACLTAPFASNLRLAEEGDNYLSDKEWKETVAPYLFNVGADLLNIPRKLRPELKNFVLGESKKIPKELKEGTQSKEIYLLKGLLSEILRPSLQAKYEENFGFSDLHAETKEYAVCYRGHKTPNETEASPSQYENPHETLVKTFISYLKRGLTNQQVVKLLQHLQKEIELADNAEINPEAAKLYASFFKKRPTKPLNELSLKEIKLIAPLLRRNTKAIFYYIRHFAMKNYKLYPKVFTSTSQNFLAQLSASLLFTATPPRISSISPEANFIQMKNSTGRITHLLLTKNNHPDSFHICQAITPKGVLKAAHSLITHDPAFKATIDIGALGEGKTNLETAMIMAERFAEAGRDDIEAIVFFDEKEGQFKNFHIATKQVRDFDAAQGGPNRRITHYDQNRCMGADIGQDPFAVALILLGKRNSKDLIAQGAGRMRGLHLQQLVEWLIPSPLAKEIFKERSPNMMDLLVHLISVQAKDEADVEYSSQRDQMQNELRRPALNKFLGIPLEVDLRNISQIDKIVDAPVDVDAAIRHFSDFESLFLSNETCDPERRYAEISEELPAIECLQYEYDRLQKHVSELNFSPEEKQAISERLNLYPKHWPDLLLPALRRRNEAGIEMECEVMEEEEEEVEQEQEVETHTEQRVDF